MFGSEAAINRGGLKTIPRPIVTVYATAGSFTHTFDPASTVGSVEVVGGGGQGGNGTSASSTRPCGGGGSYGQSEFDIVGPVADVVVAASSSGTGNSSSFTYLGVNIVAGGGANGNVNVVRVAGGVCSGAEVNINGGYGLRVESAMVNGMTPSTGRSALSPVGCASRDGTAGAGGPGAETYGGERNGAAGIVIVKEWAV